MLEQPLYLQVLVSKEAVKILKCGQSAGKTHAGENPQRLYVGQLENRVDDIVQSSWRHEGLREIGMPKVAKFLVW